MPISPLVDSVGDNAIDSRLIDPPNDGEPTVDVPTPPVPVTATEPEGPAKIV